MKNFWVISNMYPSAENPRYGVFVKNFIIELEKLGVNFIEKSLIAGQRNINLLKKIRSYFTFYKSILGILLFRHKKIDAIYVHFPLHVAFLLLFVKIPIYLNFHGSEISRSNKVSKLLFFFLAKLCRNKNVKIVVPSESFKIEVKKLIALNNEKFIVYPSGGINRKVFFQIPTIEKKQLRRKYDCHEHDFILGFISNLIEGKGILVFLDALRDLSARKKSGKITVIIAGDGPLQTKVHAFSNEYKRKFNFIILAAQSQLVLSKLFNMFDVFIFPSHRKEESLGLVGLEAMSCGCITIGANNGGIPSYINHGKNGFLFQPKDYSQLAELIETSMFLTKEKKKRLEANAIETATQFESQKVNMALLKILSA